jgi:U3 small nucleolar RNA-associated protein 18
VFLKDLPISQAAFSKDGSEVVATGKRKYFYSIDLESGKVNKVPEIIGGFFCFTCGHVSSALNEN